MSKQVKVLVLRTAGTNCDAETANAFKAFGATVDSVHINKLISKEVSLNEYHILAIPGGFTYGDDIESGRILSNELKVFLTKDLSEFVQAKKLIIGICNGFQVLVKAGLLPGTVNSKDKQNLNFVQNSTLTVNDSSKFEDRWTYLSVDGNCVWTRGVKGIVYYPVAHAEGKFVPKDQEVFNQLKNNGQIIFRYCNQDGSKPSYPANPNGAYDDIAGICDLTGRILGLMPHPERHFIFENHPSWSRLEKKSNFGDGAAIFKNGIEYVKENLLRK